MPYFGFVSPIRVKNGSTDITIASSTGGLYQQGVALPNSTQLGPLANVTWPTTGAQTLVNTTGVQSLTNKTINNITITDPGSAATLTITSGGTLEAIGAFQHKFTSTANSAATLPPATDALLMWTTEAEGKITAKTSQINVLGVAVWPTTTAHTLVATTVAQTLDNKTLGAGTVYSLETLVCSSGGVSPSSAVAYGISRITANTTGGDFSTSPQLVTLAAPIVGVEKIIVFETTAAAVNTLDVDLGAGVGVDGSTTNRYIAFSTLATLHQSVTLMGMTTALWAVKNVNSTVGQWGAATGIRSETAARTS